MQSALDGHRVRLPQSARQSELPLGYSIRGIVNDEGRRVRVRGLGSAVVGALNPWLGIYFMVAGKDAGGEVKTH